MALCFALGFLLTGPCPALLAQEQPGKTQQSDLTDGLLDLLKPAEPAGKNQGPEPVLTPADVGLEDEDLSEQSDNPLLAVRQSMLIAAGFLERGMTNADTQQLQSDIVQRLDELIGELERPQNESEASPPEPSAGEQTQSQSQNQTTATQQSTSTTQSESRAEESAEPQQGGDDLPGQVGAAADAVEDLKDPVALQRSVWGKLPEQVRQQMQSQMVEQFLPSYRAQIEAYFKSLLEQR